MRIRTLAAFLFLAALAHGQTSKLNLGASSTIDFSGVGFTRPESIGTALPKTCLPGQLFFLTSTGGGFEVCTSTNTWSLIPPNGGSVTPITSGNATSIGGIVISTSPPPQGSTLVYLNGTFQYVKLYTLENGNGASVTSYIDAAGTNHTVVNANMGYREVSGSVDTLLPTDCGGVVAFRGTTATSETLPQPSLGGNFLAGCAVTFLNYTAPLVQLVPSSGTQIGYQTSQTISAPGAACGPVISDGTNWQVICR